MKTTTLTTLAVALASGILLVSVSADGTTWVLRTLLAYDSSSEIYEDYPPPETLPPEELEWVLQEWDAAAEANDLRAMGEVIRTVSAPVPKGYRLAGSHVLRYDNPELVERILGRYKQEMKWRDMPIVPPGTEQLEPGSELHFEHLDKLSEVALLRFSPEIYDTALKHSWGDSNRTLYLATVYPENTLALVLETKPKAHAPNRPIGGMRHSSGQISVGSVRKAFEIMYLVSERHPDVIKAYKDAVMPFIENHGTYYAGFWEVSYKEEPTYPSILDYETRSLALKVLRSIAEPEDVDTIKNIMEKSPIAQEPKYAGRLKALGTKIIQEIESGASRN